MALVSKNFADIITFSRASGGWCWNSSSNLAEVAANMPRFDYDPVTKAIKGMLVEEQRTNKCTNRNANPTDLTGVTKGGDAAATLTLVDDSAALAAAGLSGICSNGMVYKLDNSAGAATSWAIISGSSGNSNAHSSSVFVRGTGNVVLEVGGAAGTGNLALTASYVRRVNENKVPPNTSSGMAVVTPPGSVAYFILNQLEEGSFATSPIVTAGSQVTRAADVASVNTLSPWFNQSEGTLLVQLLVPPIQTSTRAPAEFGDGTLSNRIAMGLQASNAGIYAQAIVGGVPGAQGVRPVGGAVGESIKIGMAYGSGSLSLSVKGSAATSISQAALPPVSKLGIGSTNTGQIPVNSHIQRVTFFPKRYSESELQALTAA